MPCLAAVGKLVEGVPSAWHSYHYLHRKSVPTRLPLPGTSLFERFAFICVQCLSAFRVRGLGFAGVVRRARREVRHGQRRGDRRLQGRLRFSFEAHERGLLLLQDGKVSTSDTL